MSQAQIQASPEEDVLYEVSEHIATITINREAVQNTISGAMLDRVTELFLQADRDRDIRCISSRARALLLRGARSAQR